MRDHPWIGDLATDVLGAIAVATVVYGLERRAAKNAAKRDLQHMLGTGEKFPGIDLRGRDLAGSYLAGKGFRGARFDGANLAGANLVGTDLSRASLTGADLRGANFKGPPPPLFPGPNLYPSQSLYPSAGAPAGVQQLPDAELADADITGAKYDSATAWPDNYDPADKGAVMCEARRSWWRRLFGG